MTRIENSSQPTSSRKRFNKHIMAGVSAYVPFSLSPCPILTLIVSGLIEVGGLTIIINDQTCLVIIKWTNRFCQPVPRWDVPSSSSSPSSPSRSSVWVPCPEPVISLGLFKEPKRHTSGRTRNHPCELRLPTIP